MTAEVKEPAVVLVKPDRIEWKPVGQFKVEGRRIYVEDSWMIACGSVDLPITPGVYDIDAKLHYYHGSNDTDVALLRGRLQGSTPDGEGPAGEFGVDVASAGVIDADALDRWVAADEKAFEAWQQEFCEGGQEDPVGFFPCPGIGSSMLFTSTGFGDGGYTAVALLEGTTPVGFEVRFLDDAGYPPVEPYRAKTWKEWAVFVLTAPILWPILVLAMLLGFLARWSRRLAKGRRSG